MTNDEFVYWLSGYISAINGRVKVPNEHDWDQIKLALSTVKAACTLEFKLEGQ